jgi:hypothetical protein
MHDFWNDEAPEMRLMNQVNFTKNAALLGAALALASIEEPWPLSLPIARPEKPPKSTRIAA